MKPIQTFMEGLLNKDNKTKTMSMVDVFLNNCTERDPLSVWDAFENTGICKTSGRLTYDGYTLVKMSHDSEQTSIKIPIENTIFYNAKTPKSKNIIVFELLIKNDWIRTCVYDTNYIPHDSYNPRDKEMMVPVKEAIEMLRALLESNKFTAYPVQDSLKNLIRNLKTTNLRDDHGNIIMAVKISNIIKRWLEKMDSLNGYKKERGT